MTYLNNCYIFVSTNNKTMKKFFKKIFNTNTGYYLIERVYEYNCKIYIGYVLCQGYIMFGIPGYKRLGIFVDKSEADEALKFLTNE